MRANTFSAVSAGMSRLREKGGASAETLYEGTNCYVNASRMPQRRPGTLNSHTYSGAAAGKTHGLATFNGNFYTFTVDAAAAAASTTSYKIVRLIHPSPSFAGDISKIHFAKPYMGHMYVVAEFTDGNTYHYWLQEPPAWQQFHIYDSNELVQPTVVNGFYYRAFVANLPPAWQANHQYNLGDLIQPTVYDGYYFTAQTMLPNALGPTPSGTTEPTWNASAGALTVESSAGNSPAPSAPPTQPNTVPQGRGAGGKYTNPGGTAGTLGSFANPSPRTP